MHQTIALPGLFEKYPDKDTKIDHSDWQKDTALFLRYDNNDSGLIKVGRYQVNVTAGNVLAIDNLNRSITEQDWNLYTVKVTYRF